MKKIILAATAALVITPAIWGQSAVDALQLTTPDFRGTARFMSMGGAFTALGGDLSTLTQNPAGIGIYRSSEIGATLELNFTNTQTKSSDKYSDSRTKVACNNFGYVGVARLGGALQAFQWGVTYNRVAQIDRRTSGYNPSQGGSLTNYIADFTTAAGYTESELNFGANNSYNPYLDGTADWLSILAYNSFMINPNSTGGYNGLYRNGTVADALLNAHEYGYVDQYNINFGGNVSNTLFWGLGVSINDLSYHLDTEYSESMENAEVYSAEEGGSIPDGDAGFTLYNSKHIRGNGWKLSFGVIYKPINELRIGAAIHTPTWWSLDESYIGSTDYSYFDPQYGKSDKNPMKGSEETDPAGFNWRLKAPWRFMIGAAAVIGQNAIVSVDYERVAYNDMTIKNAVYDNYGYVAGYENNGTINQDIRDYTRGGNILRVGAEYRITPKFSVRAGYNWQSSYINDDAADNRMEIFTSGTDPSYSFNKTTQYISVGLGYKFGPCYLDGTYVHGKQDSTMHAYTPWGGNTNTPQFDVTHSSNSVVLTFGYRF